MYKSEFVDKQREVLDSDDPPDVILAQVRYNLANYINMSGDETEEKKNIIFLLENITKVDIEHIIDILNSDYITELVESFKRFETDESKECTLKLMTLLILQRKERINNAFIYAGIMEIISNLFKEDIINFITVTEMLSALSKTSLKGRNESLKIIPTASLISVFEGDNNEEIDHSLELLHSYSSYQVSFELAADIFSCLRTFLEKQTTCEFSLIFSIIKNVFNNQMKAFYMLKNESIDSILYKNINNEKYSDDVCSILMIAAKNKCLVEDDVKLIFDLFNDKSPTSFITCIIYIINTFIEDPSYVETFIKMGVINVIKTCFESGSYNAKTEIVYCLSSIIKESDEEGVINLLGEDLLVCFSSFFESNNIDILSNALFSLERVFKVVSIKGGEVLDEFREKISELGILDEIESIETKDSFVNGLCQTFLSHFIEED